MSRSTDIMQLTERVAAVDPYVWESTGDSIGYGVTHQGTLDLLSMDFQSQNYDDWTRHLGMINEIAQALPMGERAKFDNAQVTIQGPVSTLPDNYLDALGREMGAIGAVGAAVGEAIVSPVTGAASGLSDVTAGFAWKTVLPIAIAIALVLYMWKR